MTGFLSIIWRELAVGARQKATHRARLIAAAIMIAIFMVILLFSNQRPQNLGPMLFGVTSFLLYLQALLSGIRLTADCLSEEKREGTLGLLYLSGLRGSGIVLGKMAVRSLRGVYTLLATLPIFGLCILMGGVAGSVAFQTGLGLLATMFYSLAIGVLVSSIAMDEKSVFAGVVGIIAAISIVPYLLWHLILYFNPAATWVDNILWVSPWQARRFWPQFFTHISLATSLLIASVWFLNRSFKKQFSDSPRPAKAAKLFESRVNEQLDDAPFLWMLSLEKFSSRIAKAHFCATLLVALMIAVIARKTNFSMGPFMILYACHLVWKLLVLSDSLRRLHHDHRSGALELVLTTPIDPWEILNAQSYRTFKIFLPSILVLVIGNLCCYLNDNFRRDLAIIPIGGAVLLFADGATLRWAAMAQAFKPQRFPAAIMLLAFKVIFLPVLALWLFGMITRPTGIEGIFLFWLMACGIYDAVLFRRAKNSLHNLRQLASNEPPAIRSERTQPPKFLQWLLLTVSKA